MIYLSIIVLLLVQSSLSHRQESYIENVDNYLYPDDSVDDSEPEVEKKNNHFLRFGRPDERYRHEFDLRGFDDYDDFARPTRAGNIREKNDHFIRFGRGHQQDFLRFGRDQERSPRRDKENYLRFGRSISENEDTKKRSKRQAPQEDISIKRNDAFLRFGRNSNFMRFGRDPSLQVMKQLQNSEILRLLLADLVAAHKQERSKTCGENV